MKTIMFSRRISGWRYAFFSASLVLALGFFVSPVVAQTAAEPVPMTQLADVSFQNIEVLNQDGTVSGFTFDLVNGEGAQSGVRYGVQLMREANSGQWILEDERVYPEELYVSGNSQRSVEISYEAPAYLKGEYQVSLVARNTSGLVLAMARAGEITLAGDGQYVEILSDTCFLQIEGDKEATHYALGAGVDMSQNEDVSVQCQVINHFDQAVTVTPQFQTFYRSTFGKEVETSDQFSENIVLSSGVEQALTLMIPKAQAPQAYDAKLSLVQEGSPASNAVILHYVIQGESATIQSVAADKNAYAQGETAQITFAWSGQADAFAGSRAGANADQSLTVSVTLKSDGAVCGEISMPVDMTSVTQTLSIPVRSECPIPLLTVVLKNASGMLLDSREIMLAPEEALQSGEGNQSDMAGALKKPYWLATILLLLPLLILWYLVRKAKADELNQRSRKNQGKSGRVLSWLFFLGLGAGLLLPGTSEVSAATFTLQGDTGSVTTTVNLNKSKYLPGEQIEVIAGYISDLRCLNGVHEISMRVGVNGTGWKTVFNKEESVFAPYRSAFLAAPTQVSSHYVRVEVSFVEYAPSGHKLYSGFFNLPFSVVAASVNNPPTPPLILSSAGGPAPSTGNRNTSYTFQVISNDPDHDQIRYGFDWNNDSTVDEWKPSSAFVASGTPQFSPRTWPAVGTYTFKVLAQDSKAASSTWSTHTIQITSAAQYTMTVSPLPQNGRIITADGLIQCGTRCGTPGNRCSQVYPAGDEIILQAQPDDCRAYRFEKFTGACSGHGTGRCELTMNGNKTTSAVFQSTGAAVNGACGSGAGGACSNALSGNSPGLCAAGGVTNFASRSGGWSWKCAGINSGTTASCAENQCTAGNGEGGDWQEIAP